MKWRDLRKWLGRGLYWLVLFVIVLATLEGLSGIPKTFFKLDEKPFHECALVVAALVALFEAVSMRGLEMIQGLFDTREYIPQLDTEGKRRRFRFAVPEDISQIHKLAKKHYGLGYGFTERRLREWWRTNPKCFFVMLHGDSVTGYVDAFPISAADYNHVKAGKSETRISPQSAAEANEESSFYIASFLVDHGYRLNVPTLLGKAIEQYAAAYDKKPWQRVCAVAYTPMGEDWVKSKGMQPDGDEMWFVDRKVLDAIRENLNSHSGQPGEVSKPHPLKNCQFWSQLLPPHSNRESANRCAGLPGFSAALK